MILKNCSNDLCMRLIHSTNVFVCIYGSKEKKKLEKKQIEKQSQIIRNYLALCCSKKYKNYLEGRKIISKH